MPIGALQTEADLRRQVDAWLQEPQSIPARAIKPASAVPLRPVTNDPPAPNEGAYLYCFDTGSGLEVRARFANGTIDTIASD